MFSRSFRPADLLLFGIMFACLHPSVSSPAGLLLGLAYALGMSHPLLTRHLGPSRGVDPRWVHRLLSWSIIGLGAGMDLEKLTRAGIGGLGYTLVGIVFTMGFGLFIGRLAGTSSGFSLLLCSGTAICGGSAIAAVAAVLRSKPFEVSSALIVVFLLNSIALLLFPPLGHFFGLDETQFGLWSALAIHDTSSVVGAGLRYGPHALEIATTVKLARALWIVPLALAIGYMARSKDAAGKRQPFRKPWFILGFIAAAALVAQFPVLRETGEAIAAGAKRLFVVALFLIGAGFNRENLKALSVRPLIQGVALWMAVSTLSLLAIRSGLIRFG